MNNTNNIIPSYVKRLGRITSAQRNNLKHLEEYLVNDVSNLSNNYKAITIEIGFGNGDYTIEYAKHFSDELVIAAEVYLAGIGSLIGKIKENELENIFIYDQDIRVLLNELPRNSLDKIIMLFPDPWPKARHYKRRILDNEFLNQVHPKLKTEGFVLVRTDWKNYADQILELGQESDHKFIFNNRAKLEKEFITKFHERAIIEKRQIRTFSFKKLAK